MRYKLEKEIAGSYEYPLRTQYGYMAGNPVCSSDAASMVSTSIKHATRLIALISRSIHLITHFKIYTVLNMISNILTLSHTKKRLKYISLNE